MSARAFSRTADEQAAYWAARLDGSRLTPTDQESLDHWLATDARHRELLSDYCQLSADLEQQLPLLAGIREAAAENSTPLVTTAQPRPWLRRPIWAGVALTAAAAVALLLWRGHRAPVPIDIAVPAGHRQTITLADGSHVELNARTSLHAELNGRERRVRLASGEAFFSVAKDAEHPFIVETPTGSVQVTGTHFNVLSESPGQLDVTVEEGSVRVNAGAATAPAVLRANQQFVANAPDGSVKMLSATELTNALAWRQGQVVFNGMPLREAAARFARYHGRGIVIAPDAAGLLVGGRYSLDDLDGFLAMLEDALPVHVTRNLNGTVQVSRRAQ